MASFNFNEVLDWVQPGDKAIDYGKTRVSALTENLPDWLLPKDSSTPQRIITSSATPNKQDMTKVFLIAGGILALVLILKKR